MSRPKVSFTTLGCRLNQAESDSMADDLARAGVALAGSEESPDIVVINTCTVTREATKASRMAIRRAVRAHADAKVVVMGCYAVSDRAEVEAIEGVDFVFGNDEKERFAEVLGAQSSLAPLLQIGGLRRAPSASDRVRANLKVQTGCDEWCTFCIIPKTRGALRSMNEEALVEEARARVEAGARELVLTGVHLGKYEYDRGGDERSLVRLMRRLLDIDGVLRLRLSSILCRHLTDEVVDFMRDEPRVCRYLHVPLQSGDDRILAAMHRPYRAADYISAMERVQDAIPDVALATDIIVGFPGETEEAFAATERLVERVQFSKLHVFRYSARENTAAAAMADAVHPDVKRDRSKSLISQGAEIRKRFLEGHLGRRLEVLVEDERSVEEESICSGQTDDYVRVWFSAEGLLGRMVDVVAEEIRADGVRGRAA
ncbi:MAG: tRNA (N(6)-L-threonylcarbamoyladenosine(37)-C(2))-methylthiotransferase MtaB [Actinomycetota bacterium]